jgi:hypothetical protein
VAPDVGKRSFPFDQFGWQLRAVMSGRREELVLWGLVVVQAINSAPPDLLNSVHGADPLIQLAARAFTDLQRLLA